MAETTQNSFSELIENFITLQNNAFLILQKISESTTETNADSLTFTVSDVDGKTDIDYTIPTYNYFRKSIARIDNTLKSMLALEEGSSASIRNADGSYSSIYKYDIRKEPTPITHVKCPISFKAKPNWFFEDYLNPYLFVSVDVSNYVGEESNKVKVKRVILNCNTREEIEAFNEYNGSNDIDLDTLIEKWTSRGFTYINDDQIYDLSLSTLKYTGSFTILDTLYDTDGSTWYVLDGARYSENGNKQKYTKELAIGDQLSYKETLYEVSNVDMNFSNPRVKMFVVRGYDAIGKGKELEIYSPLTNVKTVEVGISYNEREVIFFKSIDERHNLLSSEWSKGIGFYTNDLSIIDNTNKEMLLSEYYDKYVDDYGYYLKGQMKENTIPSYYGETPDAPVLIATNFKVVRINDHLYASEEAEDIKAKAAEKIQLESDISQLDEQINTIKTRLFNNNYLQEVDRINDQNALAAARQKRSNSSASYASVVKALNAMKTSNVASLDDPKFRIRGFFDIPSAKYNKSTGMQEVVQFEIRYMYKSNDNTPSQTKQFDFIDEQSSSKLATFSNWVYEKTPARTKTYDEEKGIYTWDMPELSNTDVEKCNQIDIPITKGEKVAIQVRSLSEAGWPANPVESTWSNEVIIEFPEEYSTNDESKVAFDNISEEMTRVKLQEDIEATGITDHMRDSSFLNALYWAHEAKTINSGFTTSEGLIVSLYDKLLEQDKLIKELQDKISAVKPLMVVSIIDDDNNMIEVHNGDVVKLNAGYYVEEVKKISASEQTGAIITKNYRLVIENKAGSILELVSAYPGTYDENFDAVVSANDTTWTRRQYDKVPIVYNLDFKDSILNDKFHQRNWASSQLLSQFIYLRYTDCGGKNALYKAAEDVYMTEPEGSSGLDAGKDFKRIWAGFSNDDGNLVSYGYNKITNHMTEFCVSGKCDILDVSDNNTCQWMNYGVPKTDAINLNKVYSDPTLAQGMSGANEYVPPFATNECFTAASADGTFCPQAEIPGEEANKKMLKLGFYKHDRYLIGEKTCGSYFFAAPNDYDDMRVVGTDYTAVRRVEANESASVISIPLVFQYRMQDYEGKYGGYSSKKTTYSKDIRYVRRLGFDIFIKDSSTFSFDVEVTAYCDKVTLGDNTKTSSTTNASARSYTTKLTSSTRV